MVISVFCLVGGGGGVCVEYIVDEGVSFSLEGGWIVTSISAFLGS